MKMVILTYQIVSPTSYNSMEETAQIYRNYCTDLKTKSCSFMELFIPVIDFLDLYNTRNNFQNLKLLSELTGMLITPKKFPDDPGKHSIYSETFINDQQCNSFYNNYSNFAEQIQDNIKQTSMQNLQQVMINYKQIIAYFTTEKPQERIIRCLVNQIIIELTAGIQMNLDIQKAKVTKNKGKSGEDSSQQINDFQNTLKQEIMQYLEYLLKFESFEYITGHFINTIKFQAIFLTGQDQSKLIQLMLNRILYMKATPTRVAILKLIQKLQRSSIQISELLLLQNNREIINQLLKDETQVLNVIIQLISQIIANSNSCSQENMLTTFSNLSQLTISENRHVRDVYFKTFQLTIMSFFQLFKELVLNNIIDMQSLPKYISFVLFDQNIQFEQEEFNNFLVESSQYINNLKSKKEIQTNNVIQSLSELEIWLVLCIQIINAQMQELSQFSLYLIDAFQLLNNKYLISLKNIDYITNYINQTEYKYILSSQQNVQEQQIINLYKYLLENQKIGQLVQLIIMEKFFYDDQVVVIVNAHMESLKQYPEQYMIDHLQLLFYMILLAKKQNNYNQQLFNQFFEIINILIQRYFNDQLTVEWIMQQDNQMIIQSIVQLLSGIISAFPVYLKSQQQIKLAYEYYLNSFLKLYKLKYEIYDKMDKSTKENEKDQYLYINQGIDTLFQQTITLCIGKSDNLEFILGICCLDAPVLKKQFNTALSTSQINLFSVAHEVLKQLKMQSTLLQQNNLTLQSVLLDYRKLFSAAFRSKNDQSGLEQFKTMCENNGVFQRSKQIVDSGEQEQNQGENQGNDQQASE